MTFKMFMDGVALFFIGFCIGQLIRMFINRDKE